MANGTDKNWLLTEGLQVPSDIKRSAAKDIFARQLVEEDLSDYQWPAATNAMY